MKSKTLTFLIALSASIVQASTTSKFGNVELKFRNEIIMNEVGGVIADTPDQLENIVKTYLGWKATYAREFSHIPFNSPEAQAYRHKFLEENPELKNKLKKEILSNVGNPEILEKIQNSLVKWGWSAQEAGEFLYTPLSSREACRYRRRFMKEHPTLKREVSHAHPQTSGASLNPKKASPALGQKILALADAEAQDAKKWRRSS